jgi:four helix bundle suffix protein
MSVAKNSLKELLCDYEDYLRVRNLRQWQSDSKEFVKAQQLGKEHNESAFWRDLIKTRNAETVANLAIILLNQCDYLLYRYILKISERFIAEGGFREKLSQERRTHRDKK